MEAFRELVGRYSKIGITELVFYFPEEADHRQVMEEVATLPRRSGATGSTIFVPGAVSEGTHYLSTRRS